MVDFSVEGLLDAHQRDVLAELEILALRLNQRLNLYSEESTRHFYERHILHSLVLASCAFLPNTHVVDWGTGGGMPGLPLSIAFPETTFHLVDSVGKKIKAVETMARRLKLSNVHTYHSRAEAWKGEATYSVSRATAPLATLWTWHSQCSSPAPALQDHWTPGLICLKGGDLSNEIAELEGASPGLKVECNPIQPVLKSPYFKDKMIVTVTQV